MIVIVFVNKIVRIIHDCTKIWDGFPTNNLGEIYILTWRLPTTKELSKRGPYNLATESMKSID